MLFVQRSEGSTHGLSDTCGLQRGRKGNGDHHDRGTLSLELICVCAYISKTSVIRAWGRNPQVKTFRAFSLCFWALLMPSEFLSHILFPPSAAYSCPQTPWRKCLFMRSAAVWLIGSSPARKVEPPWMRRARLLHSHSSSPGLLCEAYSDVRLFPKRKNKKLQGIMQSDHEATSLHWASTFWLCW